MVIILKINFNRIAISIVFRLQKWGGGWRIWKEIVWLVEFMSKWRGTGLFGNSWRKEWTYFYELRDVFLRNTSVGNGRISTNYVTYFYEILLWRMDVFLRITWRISTKYYGGQAYFWQTRTFKLGSWSTWMILIYRLYTLNDFSI